MESPAAQAEGDTKPSANLSPDLQGPLTAQESDPGFDGRTTGSGDVSFPQLTHNPPSSPEAQVKSTDLREEDEEPAMPASFDRSASPMRPPPRAGHTAEEEPETAEPVCNMHRFSLYETATRYYIVGANLSDNRFRVLKIDRTAESGDLSLAEDDIVYDKREMNEILNTIDDGNKSTGGLKLRCNTWGVLGFIRFTGAYYMLLITKRSQVAVIGGHYVYQIDGTELVPLTAPTSARSKSDRHPEEARFLGILSNLDLSRSFYFSYSYDISRTLQHNITRGRQDGGNAPRHARQYDLNAMFTWNHYLLEPALQAINNTYDWCLPIVHGRSRFFAGARFLKRGANDLGYVANDVETEQIVSEMLTTSFHAPGPNRFANPNYTSYVQHRGSIPLHWTQDNTGVTPKPPIELNLVDPFYTAAALHFDNLFERYGAPIYVLNLVKARERTPRESKLLEEYTNAVLYLNQFLPEDKKIIYKAWDMSRASKSRDQDVIGTLEAIADEVVTTTGFFRNGDEDAINVLMQNGVARTNCIDCLDRTNAAQFVIGKRALGHQLHALGVTSDTSIDYDTDAVNLFTHMYHDHGDTIAVQYGGSHLVNTMETYRKINQWTSHSRDMVESFKRYYNNSFLDGQRQEAYNLFLGNYIFAQGQPMLWDLATDYYLHHADPRGWSRKRRRHYIRWFTPGYLRPRMMSRSPAKIESDAQKSNRGYDSYWLEYYRPLAISSFLKIFSFRMNSTLRYIPFKSTQGGQYDLSPFRVRTGGDHDPPEKKKARKGVTIIEPHDDSSDGGSSQISYAASVTRRDQAVRWPHVNEKVTDYHGIMREHNPKQSANLLLDPTAVTDKTLSAQWTLDQFVNDSLHPSVTKNEREEYERYVTHPLNVPLVVSTEPPSDPSLDFLEYVNSVSPDAAAELYSTEEDIAEFADFLTVSDNPLTVSDADAPKKRYKAYRQWLKGKSLFKQQRVEP
ncbi:MAG: phosphatidylinositol-3,5-bisphosphate 5-phosphatase [Caeruleum heppii]|nr:MAG: phosphatidylinositol-3,5-bisphosphate 5-phosphatase [Caeruleum heppii]